MSDRIHRSQGTGQPEFAGTPQPVGHIKQKPRKTHQGKKAGVPRQY